MMMINHIIHKMIYDLEQQQAEFYMHKKKKGLLNLILQNDKKASKDPYF